MECEIREWNIKDAAGLAEMLNNKKILKYELFTSTRSQKNIALYERLGYRSFAEKQVTNDLRFVYMEKEFFCK